MIEYAPIGEFQTELTKETGAPRQGVLSPENKGVIEILPVYREALMGLEKCSHIIVIYHLHMSYQWHPVVRPPGSNKEIGLFAARSPNRPNPIGFAVIRLEAVEGMKLHVSGIDAFDGTPVLDIKPWLSSIDNPPEVSSRSIEKDLGLTK